MCAIAQKGHTMSINITSFTCYTIKATAELYQKFSVLLLEVAAEKLATYQKLIGYAPYAEKVAARRAYRNAMTDAEDWRKRADIMSMIAKTWIDTRFTVVDYIIDDAEFGDIYDYSGYFMTAEEQAKFERENMSVGNKLTVLNTYKYGIDQLPGDLHDDYIKTLFSEWV